MNDILMEIFPEAVANSIFELCIHPVAELYILERQELIFEYTKHFLGNIDHYEGVIRRGLAIRQFYYDDSDEEDAYTDFIQNYI
jgi:hypothetical protein